MTGLVVAVLVADCRKLDVVHCGSVCKFDMSYGVVVVCECRIA